MDKILIIDDNQELRENYREILQMNQYEVILAENGEVGIGIAGQAQPDLILCDIQMPGMSGFDVFCRIKSNKETKFIPFVFLTSMDDSVFRCQSLNAGADDFISKTASEAELISTIKCRIQKTIDFKKSLTAEKLKYIQELESLLNTISHSVRSPLCSSLGLLNVLELRNILTEDDKQIKMILEGIKNNTLKLDVCTKDFTKLISNLVSRKTEELSNTGIGKRGR